MEKDLGLDCELVPIEKERDMAKKDEFGVALFEEIVDHLWVNRHQVYHDEFEFGYPDFGGLSPKITKRLTDFAIGCIHDEYGYRSFNHRRKASFRKSLKELLFPLSET
jgi:hypothetical protein